MSFVAAAATVGGWVGLTGTAAVIGGGAMIGAGVGGAYSALTGDGKILDSMLTGAGIGGLGAWGLSAAGVGGTAAGAGGVGAAGAGTAGAGTTAAEVAAASNTPAVAAYGGENAFAYNAAGEMVPANYAADITGATNLPEPFVGPPDSAKLGFFERLTPKEMLGYGLGATTLMGLLGGNQKGTGVPVDKGMIRPYEYSVAKRETEGGKPYYAQPVQYDKYGKTVTPMDTSERNYFTQNYKALPTYAAANGGQVPRYEQMQPGGLAAIQGMRDGYGAPMTLDGNIPQFSNGGYTYDAATQKYNEVAPVVSTQRFPETGVLGAFRRLGLAADAFQSQNRGYNQDDGMPRSISSRMMRMFGAANPDMYDQTNNAVGAYLTEDGKRYLPKLTYDAALQRYTDVTPKPPVPMYTEEYARPVENARAGGLMGFAGGGISDLGGYSDGGRLLKGPGDGVSDSIPATINNKQPAKLADGEFVVPARIVSELGNGSTDAGAKRLYEMMDRIQADRKKTVGKGKVAVDSKAKKHLPA